MELPASGHGPGRGGRAGAGVGTRALGGRAERRPRPGRHLRRRLPGPRDRPAGAATVVARSADGERLTTVATSTRPGSGPCRWNGRRCVRTGAGRWRLYVCSATPESKHWWIDVLEADDPAGLADAEARTVFGGDDRTAVKDPVVRVRDGRWHAWICCHPLDQPGEEDRMTTAYATSEDGLVWDWHGTALAPRPGHLGRPRDPGHRRPPRRPGHLRRPRLQGGELLRAHRPGPPHRAARRAGPGRRRARRRRPLPGRRAAPGRRLPAVLRGPAGRPEPRAADRAHRLALRAPPDHDPHDDEDERRRPPPAPTPSLSTTRAAASPPK